MIKTIMNALAFALAALMPVMAIQAQVVPDGLQVVDNSFYGYNTVVTDGAKMGVIDSAGGWIIPMRYDFIKEEGRGFTIYENLQEGRCDAQGHEIIPPVYVRVIDMECDGNWYYLVYRMNDEPIYDYVNEYDLYLSSLLDSVGNTIVPFKYNLIDWMHQEDDSSYKPLLEVRDKPNGKFGVMNFDGDIVVPIEYDEFVYGYYYGSIIAKKDGKIGLLDNEGQVLLPFEFDDVVYNEIDMLFALNKKTGKSGSGKDQWAFYDIAGNALSEHVFEMVNLWDFQYIVKTEKEYRLIGDYSDGLVPFTVIPESKVIDTSDESGVENWACYIDDVWYWGTDHLWGYMDERGKVVINPKFREADSFSEGVAKVIQPDNEKGACGYIDRNGTFVIPPIYDDGFPCYDGGIIVWFNPTDEQPEHNMLLDKQGKLLRDLPEEFFLTGDTTMTIEVYEGDEVVYYDMQGNELKRNKLDSPDDGDMDQ